MLVNGKRSGLTRTDFEQMGELFSISKQDVQSIIEQVRQATTNWPDFAERHTVLSGFAGAINNELKKLRDNLS